MEYLIHKIIWTTLTFINLVISFIIFASLCYKKKMSTEDKKTCQKFAMQSLFLLGLMVLTGIRFINNERAEIKTMKMFWQFHMSCMYYYNISITLENYKLHSDPTLIFSQLFTNTNNYWRFLLAFVGTTVLVLVPSLFFEEVYFACDCDYFYFNTNYVYVSLSALASVVPLVVLQLNKRNLISYGEKRSLLNKMNNTRVIDYSFYMVFSLLQMLMQVLINSDQNPSEYFVIGMNYLNVLVVLVDNILSCYLIAKTNFFYYTLSNRPIGSIYKVFRQDTFVRPLFDTDITYSNKESAGLFLHEKFRHMIEDHFIEAVERVVNLSLSGLFIIHKRGDLKTERERLLSNTDILRPSESPLLEPKQNQHKEKLIDKEDLTTNEFYLNAKTQTNTTEYEFIKNSTKNDFHDENFSVSTEEFSNKDLNLRITSMFPMEFDEMIKLKKFDQKTIRTSFISHMNSGKGWNSLLIKNCKEDSFNKQRSLNLKSYDNTLNFEISTLDKFNLKNIKAYLDYIQKNQMSFLPIILGVYKVKLNTWREFVLIVSKNILIEDIPREYFNYWQLIRLEEKNKLNKITSSKDRVSFLIKDDVLFSNDIKLNLNNYDRFEETLQNDLTFLRRISSSSFNLLIMYYEFGRAPNLGNISSSSQDDNTPSGFMNRVSLPITRVSDIKRTYFDRVDCESESYIIDLKREINMFQFKDKVGFEASFNSFKCMFFFMFENIFEHERMCVRRKHYKKFLREILSNFDESKL